MPRPRRIGVGVADGGRGDRRFLFHLGAGFDAATVREMEERHAHLKRHLAHPGVRDGHRRDVAASLRPHDQDHRRHPRDRDGAPRLDASAEGPYVVVSNSDPYTYVGRRPVTISPRRDPRPRARGHGVPHPAREPARARRRIRPRARPSSSRRRPTSRRSVTSGTPRSRRTGRFPGRSTATTSGARPSSRCATSPTPSPSWSRAHRAGARGVVGDDTVDAGVAEADAAPKGRSPSTRSRRHPDRAPARRPCRGRRRRASRLPGGARRGRVRQPSRAPGVGRSPIER